MTLFLAPSARVRAALFAALCIALLLLLLGGGTAAKAQTPAPAAPAVPGGEVATTPVLINEILAHTDPPLVDSVELFNRLPTPVALGGWCLSDDSDAPCKLCLADALTVPPFGYLVLGGAELGFNLSEMGEELLLSQGVACTPTGPQHLVRFDASPNGVSLGRVVTSNGGSFFPLQRALSLGATNVGPLAPALVLAEINAEPAAGGHEYLEIFNPGTTPMALYDAETPPNPWQIEGVGTVTLPQLSLAPGQSLFATSSQVASFRAAYGLPASGARAPLVVRYSGSLQNEGERVALLRPEPRNVDDRVVPFVVIDEVGADGLWPWSATGVQARVALTGFGQEPNAWGAPLLPLATGASLFGLQMEVAPAGGAGGRVVRWLSTREWRTEQFTVTVETLQPAGAAASAPLQYTLPAAGSRHQAAAYAVAHTTAQPGASYRYTLTVRWWDGSESVLRTVESGPEARLYLPLAAR